MRSAKHSMACWRSPCTRSWATDRASSIHVLKVANTEQGPFRPRRYYPGPSWMIEFYRDTVNRKSARQFEWAMAWTHLMDEGHYADALTRLMSSIGQHGDRPNDRDYRLGPLDARQGDVCKVRQSAAGDHRLGTGDGAVHNGEFNPFRILCSPASASCPMGDVRERSGRARDGTGKAARARKAFARCIWWSTNSGRSQPQGPIHAGATLQGSLCA